MFRVESPSMVINDSRAAVEYRMDFTMKAFPSSTMENLANAVVNRANQINRRIKNLVLTAHGLPGSFQIGTGLDLATMSPFSVLRNKVRRIWFRGCLVGRIINSQTQNDGDFAALQSLGVTSGNGHAFLSAFAGLTRCEVIAATEMQASASRSYPQGIMDRWEGLVVMYNPQGRLVLTRRNPSLFGYNEDASMARMPNRE